MIFDIFVDDDEPRRLGIKNDESPPSRVIVWMSLSGTLRGQQKVCYQYHVDESERKKPSLGTSSSQTTRAQPPGTALDMLHDALGGGEATSYA